MATRLMLQEFRIQNYQIIEDTGWMTADDVIALVGINESGKTALLKALYKLNPATPSSYDALAEFPHDRYSDYQEPGSNFPVASARFAIDDELKSALTTLHEDYATIKSVICTRFYDNHLQIELEPAIQFESLKLETIRAFIEDAKEHIKSSDVPDKRILDELDQPEGEEEPNTSDILAQFKTQFFSLIEAIRDELSEANVEQTVDKLKQGFEARIPKSWQQKVVAPLIKQLGEFQSVRDLSSVQEKAIETVEARLPVFIYFEDYGTLEGDIFIPHYLAEVGTAKPSEWIRTVNALFKLSAYPIQKISSLHSRALAARDPQRRELTPEQKAEIERALRESAIRSESSALKITKEFNEWWPVGDYTLIFYPTLDFFELRVKDERRDISVELEYRSRGFRYFLSFYLVFEAESEGGHKDAILLLDEPGLHLHPKAQQKLMSFFDSLIDRNQIFYSTHSPFMIDGHRLDRVRIVRQSKKTGETIVTDHLGPTEGDAAVVPIQGALEYSISQTLFMGKKCLIVEGWTDFWTLKMMDKLFIDADMPSLDSEIVVRPTGGTNNIPFVAELMVAQEVPFLILLDSDKAGKHTRQQMTDNLIALSAQFIMIGDVLEVPTADLESLFPVEYFLSATAQAYGVQAFTEKELPTTKGGLSEAIRKYFQKQKWEEFDKAKVYLWLMREWSTKSIDELPEELVMNVEKVFDNINNRIQAI